MLAGGSSEQMSAFIHGRFNVSGWKQTAHMPGREPAM
jgi:hypothetical protein